MKKNYIELKMVVLTLETEDILTSSLDNFFDGEWENWDE